MAKVLKCGDVVPGCKEEIKGDSEHDVLRKAAEHAKTAHHMDSIPPEVLSKVKGAIHDEGECANAKGWFFELADEDRMDMGRLRKGRPLL